MGRAAALAVAVNPIANAERPTDASACGSGSPSCAADRAPDAPRAAAVDRAADTACVTAGPDVSHNASTRGGSSSTFTAAGLSSGAATGRGHPAASTTGIPAATTCGSCRATGDGTFRPASSGACGAGAAAGRACAISSRQKALSTTASQTGQRAPMLVIEPL